MLLLLPHLLFPFWQILGCFRQTAKQDVTAMHMYMYLSPTLKAKDTYDARPRCLFAPRVERIHTRTSSILLRNISLINYVQELPANSFETIFSLIIVSDVQLGRNVIIAILRYVNVVLVSSVSLPLVQLYLSSASPYSSTPG